MKIEDIKDISALSKEDRIRYDESIKVYRDRLVVMEYARQKGFEEGFKEGFKEDFKKGLEEGRKEERIKNACGMKAIGIPAELIARITGMTLEEVNCL